MTTNAAIGVEPDAITRRSVNTFALKIAATALGFVISLVLARTLSADGYGVYVYAAAWTNLLIGPATLGFDRLLIRQVAVYRTKSAWELMRGLLRQARRLTLLTSIGLTIAAGIVVWLAVSPSDRQMRATLWLALLSVPFLALISLQQATAQGLKQVVLGQLPMTLIRPLFFILLIVSLHTITGASLLPAQVMALSLVVTLLTLAIGAKILHTVLPAEAKARAVYQTENWRRQALPLLWMAGLYLLNSQMDTIMLGTMREPTEVAIYNIANRTAEFLTFPLFAVSVTLAPVVAELWMKGEVRRLQQVVRKSVRAVAAVSIPLAIGLVVFGRFVLRLFGPEFEQGYHALVILLGGQLINALAGSVGVLLVMTNHERDVIIAHGLSLCVIIVLSAALIPWWGIEGTAVARVGSLIFWNLFLAFRVRARLGIHPSAFGRLRAG
jgi:O-antigen/teichoic acid export membrane protein